MLRIGVDTGGTFTDFVVAEEGQLRSFKLPSTPADPEKAVLEGLARIVVGRSGFLVQHGSTVATNALLERKGARTLLVTNEGFEDLLEIGRQDRPRPHDLCSSRLPALVPRRMRLGIKERRDHRGQELVALERKSLAWLRNKVKQLAPEAIAVVLLYSHLDPASEMLIAEALEFAGVPIILSHQVFPESREYERTSAAVLNAYLSRPLDRYLAALSGEPLLDPGQLTVMESSGGTVPVRLALAEPQRTLFSGPAGGVLAASELLTQAGYPRTVTLDMGGTSTDVSLCDQGLSTTREAWIDGQPVGARMIDVRSSAVGGGAIAWVAAEGLCVGPESAGGDPGPVCWGKGEQVTVTDANLFLGRLDPERFLGGEVRLYPERVGPALEELAARLSRARGRPCTPPEAAEGIIRTASQQVKQVVRRVSLDRGYDTRQLTLACFGGAAGLHACDVARDLLFPRVVVPPSPGVLSALGVLRADLLREASRTVLLACREPDFESRLETSFAALEERLRQELSGDGLEVPPLELGRSVEVRYRGQSHGLEVALPGAFQERFHQLHQERYGQSNPDLPLEVVNVRVTATGRFPPLPTPRFSLSAAEPVPGAMVGEREVYLEGRWVPTRTYLRERLLPGNELEGPSLILEYGSTTLVAADFRARIDEWRSIVIEPRG